jgi:hypothetical protein
LEPFTIFGKFYSWQGPIYVLGMQFTAQSAPWWYVFSWIPIIVHPLVLILCLIGWILIAFRLFSHQAVGHSFFLRKKKKWNLSLPLWLTWILLLSFTVIIVQKPTLYDEERHLMFLYPVLFLLGGLGLDFLRDRTKYILVGAIIFVSIFSYIQWSKYSYVYKSPLIPNRHANQFMGDYWAICMGDAVAALEKNVPPGTKVAAAVRHIVQAYDARFHESLLNRDPDFGHYTYLYTDPDSTPDTLSTDELVMLEYNNRQSPYRFLNFEGRSSRVLWEEKMPLGDTSCAMILFEKR